MAQTGKRQLNKVLITNGEDGKEEVTRPVGKTKKLAELQEERASEDSVQSEEDQGHRESQRFMQITKALQKQQAASRNNRHVADFRKLVMERNEELQRLLKGKSNGILEQKANIRQALALGLQNDLVSEEKTEGQRMPQASTIAAGLLSKSKDLVERYSALCEHVGSKEGQRLRDPGSEADVTLLRAVMSKQESYVSSQLQRLLSEAKGQSKEAPPAPVTSEEGCRTWDQLMEEPTVHSVETATLGMAARQAKKAIKRLVKDLPEE